MDMFRGGAFFSDTVYYKKEKVKFILILMGP